MKNKIFQKLNNKSFNVTFFALFGWALFVMLISLGFCAKTAIEPTCVFASYFYKPLILLLNFIPALLICLFFYFITNRVYLSGVISSSIALVMLYINEMKIIFRNDVFTAVDLTLASEAMNMAERYKPFFDWHYAFAIVAVAAGAILSKRFFKSKVSKKSLRLVGAVLSLFVLVGSVSPVYVDRKIYDKTENMERCKAFMSVFSEKDQFVSRGFIYSYLHSFGDVFEKSPENYKKADTKDYLSKYTYDKIPEDKKINIISVMLEAYNDFGKFPGVKLTRDPYKEFRRIKNKSIYGNVHTNTFGGGTINTERAFITGFCDDYEFRHPIDTYARYLKNEGYITEGSHPGHNWFYNRDSINSYMGFDNYYFFENRYETIYNEKQKEKNNILEDKYLFEDIMTLYREGAKTGKPYFSFSVSYQNHGPYNSEGLDKGIEYARKTKDMTDEAYYILNNYLAGIAETGKELKNLINEIEKEAEPVLFVAFGDHNPWLGNGNFVYHQLGINIDRATPDGLTNYYAVPYIIYANRAAKEVLEDYTPGFGGDFSAMFLMNKVFDVLSFGGDEYKKFSDNLLFYTDVITNEGFYRENGEFTRELSAGSLEAVQMYEKIKYYRKHNDVSEK